MEFVQEEIATLHDFGQVDHQVSLDSLGVVVPIAGADIERPSVERTLGIVSEHRPGSLVVPIRGDRAEYEKVRDMVEPGPTTATVLWCNAPGMKGLLEDVGVDSIGTKGLDVWLGIAVASEGVDSVVVHDADSTSYTQTLLPRLAWPLEHGADFSKGYYARIDGGQLYGRLMRLLWTPLIRTISDDQSAPILSFLEAFRYPLAGEFAFQTDIARDIRIPRGWGLEVGLLGEVFEAVGGKRSAQVDLGWHRHDHRPVGGSSGLATMARDVAGTVLAVLEARDISVDRDSLVSDYRDRAMQYLDQYETDAAFNGLIYDREDERRQIVEYARALERSRPPRWLPPIREVNLDVGTLQAVASEDRATSVEQRGDYS